MSFVIEPCRKIRYSLIYYSPILSYIWPDAFTGKRTEMDALLEYGYPVLGHHCSLFPNKKALPTLGSNPPVLGHCRLLSFVDPSRSSQHSDICCQATATTIPRNEPFHPSGSNTLNQAVLWLRCPLQPLPTLPQGCPPCPIHSLITKNNQKGSATQTDTLIM